MNRIAVAAVGIALSVLAGSASVAAEERPPRSLDLRCRDASGLLVESPAVACGWSAHDVGGYRLVRGTRDEDRHVVFRTEDPRHTRHVDRTVRAGTTYVYVVHAVDDDGRILFSSQPVEVSVGGGVGVGRP